MWLSYQNINRVVALLFLFLILPGWADIVTPFDRGRYLATGYHDTSGHSYAIGSPGELDYLSNHFMAFDLSGISEQILSAEFRIDSPYYSSADPFETYKIYDITSDMNSILDGSAGVAGFNDMQTGNLYGSIDVSSADNGTILSIQLNSMAIQEINNHLGGWFALGGTVSTLDFVNPRTEEIFGFSDPDDPTDGVSLVLTVIPEPSVNALLLLGGGLIALRRKRIR